MDVPDDVFEYIVRKTSGYVNSERRVKFSGDHLYALCRGLARQAIRKDEPGPCTQKDVDAVIGDAFEMMQPTKTEEAMIATHECGHALVGALLPEAARPEKVTIEGDEHEELSYYTTLDVRAQGLFMTRKRALAQIATAFGGRAAEEVFYGHLDAGAYNDLFQASNLARTMLEAWGMGSSQEFCYQETKAGYERRRLSDTREQELDREVAELLDAQRERAKALIEEHRETVAAMRDLLLEKKALDRKDLKDFFKERGYTVDWREPLVIKDSAGNVIEKK